MGDSFAIFAGMSDDENPLYVEELHPREGFTYNIGRIVSAAAPFTVGKLATTVGFQIAFAVGGAAYLLAALAWM